MRGSGHSRLVAWAIVTVVAVLTAAPGAATAAAASTRAKTPAPPSAPLAVTASASAFAATVSWTKPATKGSSAILSYHLVADPGGAAADVGGRSKSATVEGLQPGVAYTFTVVAQNAVGPGPVSAPSNAVTPTTPGSRFVPVAAERVLDPVTLKPKGAFTITVAGSGGIPAAGAAAVLLRVHATRTAAAGGLRLYPAGTKAPSKPVFSTAAGDTRSTSTLVRLGTSGAVTVRNDTGTVQVALDAEAWVPASPELTGTDNLSVATTPANLFNGDLAADSATDVDTSGVGDLPPTGARALWVRVSVHQPAAGGTLRVTPAGDAPSTASAITFAPGEDASDVVLASLGDGGRLTLDSTVDTSVTVTALGWISDGTRAVAANWVNVVAPIRLADTRTGAGGVAGPLTPGGNARFVAAGHAGVPAATAAVPATAALVHVSVYAPSDTGTLTAPGGNGLDYVAGQTSGGLLVVPLDASGAFTLDPSVGTLDVTVDVVGYLAGGIVTSVRAKPLSDASLQSLTDVSASQLTFAKATAPKQVKHLMVGDILNAGVTPNLPHGLLRKVTAVTKTKTQYVLTTAPASLADAIKQGDVDVSDPGSSVPAARAASTATKSAAAATDAGGASVDADTSDTEVVTGGSVSFGLQTSAHFGMHVSVHLDPLHPVDVTSVLGIGTTFSASAGFSVAASGSLLDKELLSRDFEPIPVAIGPIVLVIVPHVDIKAYVNWNVDAAMSATVTHQEGYVASVSYADGQFDSSSNQTVDHTDYGGPTGTGSAAVTAGIDFGVQLLIDDVAGPGLTGGPYLKVTATGCGVDLSLGAHLDLTLNINTFVDGIDSVSIPLASGEKVLASSGYFCYWTGTVNATYTASDSGPPNTSVAQHEHIDIAPEHFFVDTTSGHQWEVDQAADWQADHTFNMSGDCGDFGFWAHESGSGTGSFTPESGLIAVGYQNNQFYVRLANVSVTAHIEGSDCQPHAYSFDEDRIVMPSPVTVLLDEDPNASSISGSLPCFDQSAPNTDCHWDYSLTRHLPDGSVG